eukprot:sb/3472311/
MVLLHFVSVGTYYFLHRRLARNFKRHYLETRFLDLLHSTRKRQYRGPFLQTSEMQDLVASTQYRYTWFSPRQHLSIPLTREEGQLSSTYHPLYINTGTSKQPTRIRYLGHVTGYQPIREQYFRIRSDPTIPGFTGDSISTSASSPSSVLSTPGLSPEHTAYLDSVGGF